MAKPDFLQLLGTLDKKELSNFGKHLHTAHASKKIPLQVFDYCKRFHPEYGFDIEVAAGKVFPPGNNLAQPTRKSLLNEFSALYGLLKSFLLNKKLEENSLESRILWLMVQQERGLKEAFVKDANRIFGEIRATPKLDELDYLRAMLVEYLSISGQVDGKTPTDAMLTAYSQALDTFCQISRLKVNCETTSRSNLKGAGQIAPHSVEIPAQGLHALYHQVHALLQGGGETEFLQVEKLLIASVSFVSESELLTVCLYLNNYCAKKIREGEHTYSIKALNIAKFGLEHGLYMDKTGAINPIRFLNILNGATAAGDFQWADGFIQKYLSSIAEPFYYEVKVLSMATLLFAQKQYKPALKKLRPLEGYRAKSDHIDIRSRLLKVACMVGLDKYSNELVTEIVNYRNCLKRSQSQHTDTVKAALNFLQVIQTVSMRKKSAAYIRQMIGAAKDSLVYEPWLLEQLDSYQPLKRG